MVKSGIEAFKNGSTLEGDVQPIQNAPIEQGPVLHFTVISRTFRSGEPDQCLGAAERLVYFGSAFR